MNRFQSEGRVLVSKNQNVRNLEKAITEFLTRKGLLEFRWIYEEERSTDDNFATCLMIDGDAHLYFWDLDGIGDLDKVSQRYGYFIDPINYTDIGFYYKAD